MISADRSLRSTTTQRSGIAPQSSPFSLGNPPKPPMISDRAVQSQVNNLMAAGSGQQRAALSDMDRAGVSRGRGQANMADFAASQADMKGRIGAAQAEMDAAASNANATSAWENTRNSERAASAGLLGNLRNMNAMERLARRGFGQDIYEANRRGQFGLDSQYLDTTPLLSALLR